MTSTGTARRAGTLLVATGAVLVSLASGHATAAADLGAFSGPVRFEAAEGVAVVVDDRHYVGTLEARVGRGGGVTLVDELRVDEYLEGLREVPVSWPEATLQAQVVAARTYAWWELRRGGFADAGFDLCGTQACQVFVGRDVVQDEGGQRWADAVAATTGEVLVDVDGEPLLARYSSSNGGATVANVERFPDDGDPPYLQRVEDPYDEASPYHRWQVRFPREDLDAILARGDTLRAAVPLADVRVDPVEHGEDLVVVTGRDGTEVAVPLTDFRFHVVRHAPAIAPQRYPPARPDGGRYPATLLSPQLSFTVTRGEVVVDGRGFGHGVGMSQYGAFGRAEAGQDHDQILAAYYGGATPTTPDDLPASIRVGLVEDAQDVTIELPSPTPVVVGGTTVTARGLGTWSVRRRDDRTVQLIAPEGFGAPLVVDPTTAASATAVLPAGVVRLETVVNKPVELVVEVSDDRGEVVRATSAGFVAAGRHRVDWSVAGGDGTALPSGRLRVALVAVDEDNDRGAGAPTSVTTGASGSVAGTLGMPHGPAGPLTSSAPLVRAGVLGAVAGGSMAAIVDPARRRRRTTVTTSELT